MKVKWTEEEIDFLKENINTNVNIIAKKLNRTHSAVRSKRVRSGYVNKECPTRFQNNNSPHNAKEEGAINLFKKRERVYKRIKIGKQWKYLHIYNYEKYIGEIPEGKNVTFIDGDSLNCEPENLTLITKKTLLDKNRPKENMSIFVKAGKQSKLGVIELLNRGLRPYEKEGVTIWK